MSKGLTVREMIPEISPAFKVVIRYFLSNTRRLRERGFKPLLK
jgi:hypothetical protein